MTLGSLIVTNRLPVALHISGLPLTYSMSTVAMAQVLQQGGQTGLEVYPKQLYHHN